MAARYHEIKERVFRRFPLMRSSAFERRMLFERRPERRPTMGKAISSYARAAIAAQF
jgi:hypothetical protein